MVDVDAQDLSEQLVDVLRAIAGIVGRSAIAHADVEHAVGTEADHSAVVIGERLRDRQQRKLVDARGGRARVGMIFGDDRRAIRLARVIDEEPPVRGELRVEGEAQQPLFATRQHPRADVQEHRGRRRAGRKHEDSPALLHDEEPIGSIAGVRHEQRAREALEHRLESYRGLREARMARQTDQHEDGRDPQESGATAACGAARANSARMHESQEQMSDVAAEAQRSQYTGQRPSIRGESC